MEVLVIGANRYSGAAIYRDLSRAFATKGTYHGTSPFPELLRLDLKSKADVISLVEVAKPDVIVHAAGPQDPEATRNVVKAANRVSAKVIYISTIGAREPYEEPDVKNFMAEIETTKTNLGYLILRHALLVGRSPEDSGDGFHNSLLKNVIHMTPPFYDDSLSLQVTSLSHLSEVMITAMQRGIYDDIIPVLAEQVTTKFQVAKAVLSEFGIQCIPREEVDGHPVYEAADKLRGLSLPMYKYEQVLAGVISDISAQKEEARVYHRYPQVA